MTRPPGSYRRELGRELRQARKAAEYSGRDAGRVLKCTQSKISKIESGLMGISAGELDKLMYLYGLHEPEVTRLRTLHRESGEAGSIPNPLKRSKEYQMLADLEGEASEIFSWRSERIPGPLQSEEYMLKQFELHKPGDKQLVDLLMRERQARNIVFMADPAPHYQVILSVTSFLRLPGGFDKELALDQMEHLIGLAEEYDRLELRLLGLDAKIPAAVSDFTVLKFDQAVSGYLQEEDFAYIEHSAGGEKITKIEPFLSDWRDLYRAAISPEGTLEHLKEWAGDIKAQRANELSDQWKGTTS